MKILILSDLHANLEALEAIREPRDELWVLGDLVNYGPDPCAVVDFVRQNASLVVSGNHDHAVGYGEDPRCSPAFREMARAMQAYTESVLSQEQLAYLRSLPLTARRAAGGREFFLCHATPGDPLYEYLPAEPAAWRSAASAAAADVLLVGHTHLPFELEIDGRRVINPGSLGQPKHGRPEACYAVWEDGVVRLARVAWPVERTVAKIQALPIPPAIRDSLCDVLVHGGFGGRPVAPR
jgi:putative phosphoesterase